MNIQFSLHIFALEATSVLIMKRKLLVSNFLTYNVRCPEVYIPGPSTKPRPYEFELSRIARHQPDAHGTP